MVLIVRCWRVKLDAGTSTSLIPVLKLNTGQESKDVCDIIRTSNNYNSRGAKAIETFPTRIILFEHLVGLAIVHCDDCGVASGLRIEAHDDHCAIKVLVCL